MALFTPSASPAVTVKEIDLTGVVPNVQTSTGAFVGNFGWGPVGEATLVSDETGLVSIFSAPTDDNSVDFHSAAYFLRYSNQLHVVRQQNDDAKNALGAHSSIGNPTVQAINTLEDFDGLSLDSDDGTFIAKYPGVIGNSITVSMVGSGTGADQTTNFNAWTYKDAFDGPTGTSTSISALDGSNDEVHIAVVDRDGGISGVAGTVLEAFPYLSVASNAKNDDGTSNYYKDVLKTKSQWVYAGVPHGGDSDGTSDFGGGVSTWGSAAVKGTAKDFKTGQTYANTQSTWDFSSGVSTATVTSANILLGFDKFNDADNIEVDFLIPPDNADNTAATAVVNDIVAIAEVRKDCVAVASPSRAAAITTGTNAAVITCGNTYTKSSYLVQDNNFLKVFDKYNDKYIKIPAASSTAGLMAATDLVAAPWFSPAGARRGRYLGVTDIVLSPTKAERDDLYKVGINPIANIPGDGVVLFGDKTNMSRPSAFDRINVRRLFLGIERAIGIAGRNVMFEFNDEFTRAEFVNIVEPFLRDIQGRRGITDFKVQCDETNNPPSVVDRNEFIASIFIKPARSINYVTLNFVAVRTGVEFEEVVGTV
jgi:phage tail sheath protein FI